MLWYKQKKEWKIADILVKYEENLFSYIEQP